MNESHVHDAQYGPLPDDVETQAFFPLTRSQVTKFLGEGIFVCRYLSTNKNSSLCPLRLCGESWLHYILNVP